MFLSKRYLLLTLPPPKTVTGREGASEEICGDHFFLLKSSLDYAAFRVSSGLCSTFSSSGAASLSGGSLSHVAQIAIAHMSAVRAQRVKTGAIGTALLPRLLAFVPPID